jgi:hypothetical protein
MLSPTENATPVAVMTPDISMQDTVLPAKKDSAVYTSCYTWTREDLGEYLDELSGILSDTVISKAKDYLKAEANSKILYNGTETFVEEAGKALAAFSKKVCSLMHVLLFLFSRSKR